MASYRPSAPFDKTFVGYTSMEALPSLLGQITNDTFPNLRHLTIQWDRAKDMWDQHEICPHWYIIKPIIELKRLTKLHTVKIQTPETQRIKEIRDLCAELTQADMSWDGRRWCLTKLLRISAVFKGKDLCTGNGYVFDLVNNLLTYNLSHGCKPKLHEHSEKCAHPIADLSSRVTREWRQAYCPANWSMEKLEIEGMHEELVGVYFAKIISRLLCEVDPSHQHLREYFAKQFKETETRLAFHSGHNLRKRKRVDYVELSTGVPSKRKELK